MIGRRHDPAQKTPYKKKIAFVTTLYLINFGRQFIRLIVNKQMKSDVLSDSRATPCENVRVNTFPYHL